MSANRPHRVRLTAISPIGGKKAPWTRLIVDFAHYTGKCSAFLLNTPLYTCHLPIKACRMSFRPNRCTPGSLPSDGFQILDYSQQGSIIMHASRTMCDLPLRIANYTYLSPTNMQKYRYFLRFVFKIYGIFLCLKI